MSAQVSPGADIKRLQTRMWSQELCTQRKSQDFAYASELHCGPTGIPEYIDL